jgi:hypothetical protein
MNPYSVEWHINILSVYLNIGGLAEQIVSWNTPDHVFSQELWQRIEHFSDLEFPDQ